MCFYCYVKIFIASNIYNFTYGKVIFLFILKTRLMVARFNIVTWLPKFINDVVWRKSGRDMLLPDAVNTVVPRSVWIYSSEGLRRVQGISPVSNTHYLCFITAVSMPYDIDNYIPSFFYSLEVCWLKSYTMLN